MNLNKIFRIVFLVLFVIAGCMKDVPPDDQIVAQVNGAYLLKKDISGLQESRIPGYVTRWIDQELLYQAAVKNNIHRDDIVRKQVDNYRRDILGKLFVETYYNSLPEISESELRAYYNEHISEFTRNGEEVKIYHFIFTSYSEASSAARILKKNTSGDERRKLFRAGQVENIIVKKGFLAKELNDALFNSRTRNRVVGPVKTGNIYHVIEIQERYANNSQIGFDEAYDEIYQRMLHGAIMRIEAGILDSLREGAVIRTYQEKY